MKSLEQLSDLELVTDQQKATDFRVGWCRASRCSFTLPCLWRVTSPSVFWLGVSQWNVFFSKGIQGWNIFQEQILEMSLWPQNVGQRRVPSPSFYILCEKKQIPINCLPHRGVFLGVFVAVWFLWFHAKPFGSSHAGFFRGDRNSTPHWFPQPKLDRWRASERLEPLSAISSKANKAVISGSGCWGTWFEHSASEFSTAATRLSPTFIFSFSFVAPLLIPITLIPLVRVPAFSTLILIPRSFTFVLSTFAFSFTDPRIYLCNL